MKIYIGIANKIIVAISRSDKVMNPLPIIIIRKVASITRGHPIY